MYSESAKGYLEIKERGWKGFMRKWNGSYGDRVGVKQRDQKPNPEKSEVEKKRKKSKNGGELGVLRFKGRMAKTEKGKK